MCIEISYIQKQFFLRRRRRKRVNSLFCRSYRHLVIKSGTTKRWWSRLLGWKWAWLNMWNLLNVGFLFCMYNLTRLFFLLYICNSQINNRWCHKQYVKSSVNKYKMLCYFRLNSPSKMKIKKIKRICVNLWSKKFKLKKKITIQFKHLCISIFIVFYFSVFMQITDREREVTGERERNIL